MNAMLGLTTLLVHWEARRQQALADADRATRHGRPALQHLRQSSRCEARFNKLVRVVARASTPRGAP
jgi:hypothetical protein